MKTLQNRVLLVDGMALLFRGFYATSYQGNFMINNQGIPTNGVHQLLRYFLSGLTTYKPSHVVFCWDMGKETFRNEIYSAYKANRGDPPTELIPQFDLAKQAIELLDIPNIGLIHVEADDVIGTLAKRFAVENEVIIQSGDYDLLQLVAENVHVAIMKKGIGNFDLFHIKNFYEKFSLHPHQYIDFKGFTGDAADNYPGIKGIGEKTAKKLLQTYGDINGILENIEHLSKGIQKKLSEELEMFYLSKQLATIKCDIEINLDLIDAEIMFDEVKAKDKILNLGLREQSFTDIFAFNVNKL